jgi:WD40 repeat protein
LSLAFSPDATLLAAASQDSTVRLWRIADDAVGELLALDFHAGPVTAVAFDRDATRLIARVKAESALRVWHLDRLRAGLAEIKLDW